MPGTTMTKRRFDQDASAARKAAADGPVVITDRGRPSHVLLSYDQYSQLIGSEPVPKVEPSIADLLYMPEAADIDFDPPKLNLKLRIPDFD